jgi:hypothetical protein
MFNYYSERNDRLCGLVVRVPGYRSRGPRSIPALPDLLRSSGSRTGSTQPLSTAEELLERKSRGSGLENRDYGRTGSAVLTTRHRSISKSLY